MDFEIERVDLASRRTEAGVDYARINPKGYVPALRLDDDQALTEGVAIIQYVADLRPEAGLAPEPGTRAPAGTHLNFIASEYHKAFGPFFSPDAPKTAKAAAAVNLGRRLDYFRANFIRWPSPSPG